MPPRRRLRRALCLLPAVATALLSACAYLPKDGPLRSEVADQAVDPGALRFSLLPVTQNTLAALSIPAEPGLAASFGDGPAIEPQLSVGDAVSLTVFEAGSEPLFGAVSSSGGGSRGATLPERLVALDGSIALPYAGSVPAAGHTLRELELAVQRALAGRTAQPQVLATLTHSSGSAVTVLGEAGAGARVPLTPRGERLLDVLAASGGLRGSVYDTWVELDRDGKAVRESLARLLGDPAENLRLHAGDTVLVTHRPETFTAFGATGRSAQIEFGAESLSLAEAVARAGGLQDARADPRGVFLFRYETAPVARRLGIDKPVGPNGIPVVYQFDFLEGSSYFLSQQFALRDRDVLYVASAPSNELTKFLQMIGLLTAPAISGAVVGNSVK